MAATARALTARARPALFQGNKDFPRCAEVPRDMLRYLEMLIRDYLRMYAEVLLVEQFNYQVAIRRIDELARGGIVSFCIVQITGRLSAANLEHIKNSAKGNVRVLLRKFDDVRMMRAHAGSARADLTVA